MTITWGNFSATMPDIVWMYVAIVVLLALAFRS